MRVVKKPESVVRAIELFDALGRDEFLERHGFGPAKMYFLLHNGLAYDSKAIYGAAAGFDEPGLGPMRAAEFSGGEAATAKHLRRLGFIVEKLARYPQVREEHGALVLVENERTTGGRYDSWKDVTGERYHFPNLYFNRMVTGRPFIYYRGVRRESDSRGIPEYFGQGIVGEVWRDDDLPRSVPKKRWKWFAEVEEFVPFTHPVPAKIDRVNLEKIQQNQWQVGVRAISWALFEQIVAMSGTKSGLAAIEEHVRKQSHPLDDVAPREVGLGKSLLLLRANGGPGRITVGAARRSGFAKAIGDRAEHLVLSHLRATLERRVVDSLRWVAQSGEKPGWDIEYQDASGTTQAVEVKGTQAVMFPGFEMTAREWDAARELRESYRVVLVAECMSKSPQLDQLADPVGMEAAGRLLVTPTSWRVNRVA